jgi:hypothetical protein
MMSGIRKVALMRISKSIVLVLSAATLAGLSGCGSSQQRNQAPAAVGEAAPSAPQGGFGGIACGAPPQQGMSLQRTNGDVTFYSRPDDPMQIAGGKLSGETYRFYKNQFEGALLQTDDAQSSSALLVHMRGLVGPGNLEDPNGPKYSWSDSNLQMIYERQPGAANASVIVGCMQVQAQHQADMANSQPH